MTTTTLVIVLTNAATRDLRRIPVLVQATLAADIAKMSTWPAEDLHIVQLQGVTPRTMRLRSGSYRVIFRVDLDEKTLTVMQITTREGAYR